MLVPSYMMQRTCSMPCMRDTRIFAARSSIRWANRGPTPRQIAAPLSALSWRESFLRDAARRHSPHRRQPSAHRLPRLPRHRRFRGKTQAARKQCSFRPHRAPRRHARRPSCRAALLLPCRHRCHTSGLIALFPRELSRDPTGSEYPHAELDVLRSDEALAEAMLSRASQRDLHGIRSASPAFLAHHQEATSRPRHAHAVLARPLGGQ
jgi:hypothetical protein